MLEAPRPRRTQGLEGGYDPAQTGLGAAAVLRALARIDGLR